MRGIGVVVCALAAASSAMAQAPRERARAIRPTGLIETGVGWTGSTDGPSPFRSDPHQVVHDVDVRIPAGDAVFEVRFAHGFMDVTWIGDFTTGHVRSVRLGSPRFGVAWALRDGPWRAEVGVAIRPPTVYREVLEGSIDSNLEAWRFAHYRGAWDGAQWDGALASAIAHGRFELDVDDLALGAELDVPVIWSTAVGEVRVQPQLQLEAAWRFTEVSLLGARARGVVRYGPDVAAAGYGLGLSVEPFVRFAAALDSASPFVSLAITLFFGPDGPTSFVSSGSDPAMLTVQVAGGVSF